jgi:hypothetical protein
METNKDHIHLLLHNNTIDGVFVKQHTTNYLCQKYSNFYSDNIEIRRSFGLTDILLAA